MKINYTIKLKPSIKLGLTTIFLIYQSIFLVNAQMKIGLPTGDPNSAAILDVSNTGAAVGSGKGFLPPLVALSATNVWSLAGAPTPSMMVYNTATTNGSNPVTPGLYMWLNSQWNLISMSPTVMPVSIFSGINCSGAISGSYAAGVSMTASNTKVVNGTITTAGTNNTSASTISNGVTFTNASGNIANGNVAFTLTASGTPINGGTFPYSITIGGQSCSFNVTYTGQTDAIYSALSTSVTAYSNAAADNWVSVTAAEYANILASVTGAAKFYSLDATMNATGNTSFYQFSITSDQSNGIVNIPAGSYPIALKVKDGGGAGMDGIQLQLSTASNSGYANYPASGLAYTPSVIPFVANSLYYFVLKAPTAKPVGTTANFAALNLDGGYNTRLQGVSSGVGYQIVGPTYFMYGYSINMQMLATPTKSW